MTRNIRDETSIDENACFESDQIKVIAKAVLGKLADLRVLPAMERDVEGRAGTQSRHKAGHSGKPVRAISIGEFYVRVSK